MLGVPPQGLIQRGALLAMDDHAFERLMVHTACLLGHLFYRSSPLMVLLSIGNLKLAKGLCLFFLTLLVSK